MGQKILVVEDNELNLKLFCDLLRAHGYETEPVRDGREALERARAFVPDLVVMDIQMPHVSGLELIEQMKRDDGLKRTPIMAVTAYAAKGDEERIRDAGAEGYVSKPISVVRFVEAVAALLKTAGERSASEGAEAAAVEAAQGSVAIEKEVEAEGPAAAARAVEAAAGSDAVAADAADAAERLGGSDESRQSGEGGIGEDGEGDPDSDAGEEGKRDPGSGTG